MTHSSHASTILRSASAASSPTCVTTKFGRNVAARAKGFAWTVIGTFDSSADHDRYQVSALHQEMKAFMSPHIVDIAVCDFDSAGGTLKWPGQGGVGWFRLVPE